MHVFVFLLPSLCLLIPNAPLTMRMHCHASMRRCMTFSKKLLIFFFPIQGSVERRKPRSHKFLCLRVGKPMKKTFISNASASMQQYAQQGKKHEYWFSVPQERSV